MSADAQTDRRLLAANSRVAARELMGQVNAQRYVEGDMRRIATSVADLLEAPNGRRERQLLLGTCVRVLEIHEGSAFIQSTRDGYVGYVDAAALMANAAPTHRVSASATHLYPAPDMKTREQYWLSHGSLLTITGTRGQYLETDTGHFVFARHVSSLDQPDADPVEVARLYLGSPYLWGGNSTAGIDCSGLVQAALLACGAPCPADSDQQREALGHPLPDGSPPEPGDLYFWKGHVAMAADATTLIHANAHHMAVAYEPIEAALTRIAAHEFGSLIVRKRLR